MNITFHLGGPFKKSPQVAALPDGKLPELQKSDLLHLHATISFDSPEKVGATPGGEAMSTSGVPQKSKDVEHGAFLV